MTDRELLELAAKAAKLSVFWGHPSSDCYDHNKLYLKQDKVIYTAREWDPLEDDGDALRLAVRLNLGISIPVHKTIRADVVCFRDSSVSAREEGNDPYAATRRAIVRAAAEVGRKMK